MPRPKRNYKEPFMSTFTFIGNFKSYSTDLLFDFETIYKLQLERFRDMMPDDYAKDFEEKVSIISKQKTNLITSESARAYLVTSLDFIPLMMRDIEDCIVGHLEAMSIIDITLKNDSLQEDPDHVVTLFVFKGHKLLFWYDIPFFTATKMLIAYHKENLINAGAFRDEWYGEPRRKARTEQRLWNNSK
ncbi:hypothetical protein D3Z52_20240 [Clostridiaceae bacterium]|nr:hypothetical protein [Clostridiaceae bacterium]